MYDHGDADLTVVDLDNPDARHGCASQLFAVSVAPRTVLEILGHSHIAVTTNVHTHVSDGHRWEAMSHTDQLPKRRRYGRPSPSTVNAPVIINRSQGRLAWSYSEPPVGFEPTTFALQERCSGQLS